MDKMNKKVNDDKMKQSKFCEALKKQFLQNESIRNVRSEIRKQIFQSVRGSDVQFPNDDDLIDSNHSPIVMMNHLIMDYFKWMCYRYSTDTFNIESGTHKKVETKKLKKNFKNSEKFNDSMPLLLEIMMSSMRHAE